MHDRFCFLKLLTRKHQFYITLHVRWQSVKLLIILESHNPLWSQPDPIPLQMWQEYPSNSFFLFLFHPFPNTLSINLLRQPFKDCVYAYFFLLIFLEDIRHFLWNHGFPCFGILVASTLDFTLPSNGFPRFTCGATTADLLSASMAAKPFRSCYMCIKIWKFNEYFYIKALLYRTKAKALVSVYRFCWSFTHSLAFSRW